LFGKSFNKKFLPNPKFDSPISKFLIYDFLLYHSKKLTRSSIIKHPPNKFGFGEKAAQIFGFGEKNNASIR